MSTCNNAELLRDYAFDEIAASERPGFERHLAECASCTAELDQLRFTTAALRVLPDREPPQRIAFVSDKVFAPSRFWNFAPWLGFASTAVMAVALIVSSSRKPAAEIRTVYEKAQVQPVDDIVKRAVAKAQAEDMQIFKAALAESDKKHQQEFENVKDAIDVLQAHRYVAMSNEESRIGQ